MYIMTGNVDTDDKQISHSRAMLLAPRTQKARTSHLHTGKCLYWEYVVVAQRWLSFQN